MSNTSRARARSYSLSCASRPFNTTMNHKSCCILKLLVSNTSYYYKYIGSLKFNALGGAIYKESVVGLMLSPQMVCIILVSCDTCVPNKQLKVEIFSGCKKMFSDLRRYLVLLLFSWIWKSKMSVDWSFFQLSFMIIVF